MDLESMEVKIEDEDKVILLVVSLPSSYKYFKEILLYNNNDAIPFEEVEANLLSNEKYDLEVRSDDKAEVLSVRGRSSEKDTTARRNFMSMLKGRKSSKFCKYCRKPGRVVDECYNLNNKKERDHNHSAKAAIADLKSDGDVLLITTTDGRGAIEWVLDSGCTYHICTHRIVMTLNAISLALAPFKSELRTITLSNVCHIPDLKRNLISLGIIESNGCKYSAKGGVLKIFKGALVFMKGERRGSLYILQGSTVTASTVVTTPSPTEGLNRLWMLAWAI